MIEGIFSFGDRRYKQRLRPRPYPAPNFTNPGLFQDDYLEIFRADHQSRQLVDRAIQQLQDPGLRAEVRTTQFLWEQQKHLQREQERLTTAITICNVAIINSAQHLASARGPSRIATQVIHYAPVTEELVAADRESLEPRPPTPPWMTRIPQINTGQGPADGQFTTALGPPDEVTGRREKLDYCPGCYVLEDHQGHCKTSVKAAVGLG